MSQARIKNAGAGSCHAIFALAYGLLNIPKIFAAQENQWIILLDNTKSINNIADPTAKRA